MSRGYGTVLTALGCVLVAACAGKQAGPAASVSPEAERADTVPEKIVAEAAREEGLDPEAVVEKKREAERRVEDLDPETEAEFRALFGDDPLGLARFPRNAEQYEIPLEINEKVEAWLDYFQNVIPDRFGLYLERLGRYEHIIRPKLRDAGLPQDLIFLALIESGMNPNAYSRAHAVGMWQFIRGTGRLYDLDVTYWVDERRDFVQATDAAIAHLKDLFDEFGSWYLAAAAYNAGAGRVRRALARTGADNFWDLSDDRWALRSETRNYVPKLVAAALIAKDPAKYGFGHIRPDPPVRFDEVEVPDATSMDVIADAAGVDERLVRDLNPQFVRHVTPPGGTARVRVPEGTGARFAANYAKIPPSERVTWLVHTVTRGQTLGQIARRYGTSVTAIRAANGGVNPRRLQIGQRLVVPRAASRSGGVRVASGGRPDGPVTVTVRRGDTLWSIARRYDVSPRQIIAWNGLPSTLIRPGDRLTIRR